MSRYTQSISQVLSLSTFVTKKALNPGRKLECTCARMMEKSPDVQFGIRFLTKNVESMSGKWGKISEALKKRCVDICCLQEVRWRGQGAKMAGNGFKFVWSGSCKPENGAGLMVANWLIGKIVGVKRYNDRVIKVNVVIGHVIWEEVSCYCPEAGRSVNEKEKFYELMGKVVASEKVLVSGDFKGHVDSIVGGFGEIHKGFWTGQINDRRIRLLDWTVGKGLRLMNTCFQKKSWLLRFRSGEAKAMID